MQSIARLLGRAGTALAVAITVVTVPGAASAHASIQMYGEDAVPGGYGAIFVRIPHGCTGGLATDTVTVQIPAGFASVKPAKAAGWVESRTMSGSTVTAVTWTGGSLANTSFMDFGISVKFPDAAGTYGFVTVQDCGTATTVWSGDDTPTIEVAPRSQGVDIAAAAHGHGFIRLRADASAIRAGDAAVIRASVDGAIVKRWSARLDAHGDLDRTLPTHGRTGAGRPYALTGVVTLDLLVAGAVIATTSLGAPPAGHGH